MSSDLQEPISPPGGVDTEQPNKRPVVDHDIDQADDVASKKVKVDVITPEEEFAGDDHTEVTPAISNGATGEAEGEDVAEEAEAAEEEATPLKHENDGDRMDVDQPLDDRAGEAVVSADESLVITNLSAIEPPDGEPLPKTTEKAMLNVLRMVKRLKDSGPFHLPVDTVKLNIPTYYDVVTKPIDLSTMETKLHNSEYQKVIEFVEDMEQIVTNSTLFNGDDSFVTNMAKNVRASFYKHMNNGQFPTYAGAVVMTPSQPVKKYKKSSITPAPSSTPKPVRAAALQAQQAYEREEQQSSRKSVSADVESDGAGGRRPKREIHPPKPKDFYSEDILRPRKNKKFASQLRFCQTVLKELTAKKHEAYAYPFLLPVDPVALGCPTYFKIVKHPMDLSTVQDKLTKGEYENGEEFASDVKLMFKNCYKFNPEGSPVNTMGHQLEAVFDRKWLELPPPASTPPPQDDFFDSDYSDEEGPTEADLVALNPAIKYLQGQLATLQEQLAQAKREAIQLFRAQNAGSGGGSGRKRGGRSSRGGRRKSSFSERGHYKTKSSKYADVPKEVTYAMKQELSEKIPELPEKKLRHVISIIQESMPSVVNEDEIELDIDLLDSETLRKLYHIAVVKNGGGRRPKAAGSGLGKKSKKSKPLTEAEQSRQIEEIQRKIAQFNNGGDGGDDDVDQGNDEDSDSEEDSDESSSEEE